MNSTNNCAGCGAPPSEAVVSLSCDNWPSLRFTRHICVPCTRKIAAMVGATAWMPKVTQ